MNAESRCRSVAPFAAVCLLIVAAATGWPRPVDGARVLAFETMAARSHWNFMKAVLLALADGGHRVTVYTPFPDRGAPDAPTGYTEVDTSAEFSDNPLKSVTANSAEVTRQFADPSIFVPLAVNVSRRLCDVADRLLADRGVGEFDLFVTELLTDECASHVARRLGVPLVYVVPSPLMPWIETGVFGHVANPGHEPHILSAHATVDGTFYGRLSNVALYVRTVYHHYRTAWAAAAHDDRHYDRVPPVKPALMFINTHYVTEPGRPVPANRVDVGGIHLKKPKPLPADVLKFIEESTHGVIYFSFGSIVTISTLPVHVQNMVIGALAEIPQRVLMKYEGSMKNKPKNVMTKDWLPQRDLLLHPKVKLCIGHGGISGVYEAVDAGVPVLGFPFFYDQPKNLRNLVDAGMAISLNWFSLTKDSFLNAINTIINDKTYSENAKIASERFKDRQMTPAQSVVYWTEYVIRLEGAQSLKSQALNLTWCQYFLLDVIGFLLFVILLAFYIISKSLNFIKH